MLLRTACYLWTLPNTLLGAIAVVLALGAGGRVRIVDGVLEVSGPRVARVLDRLPPTGAMAITLGHVVLGRSAAALDITRTHERVHVRQYERWGPLFIPAYLGASLVLLLRGRDAYRDNPFEREAYGAASKDE